MSIVGEFVMGAASQTRLNQQLSRREFCAAATAVVAGSSSVLTLFATDSAAQAINKQEHLNVAGRVNLGSFYTPAKYVSLVGDWLRKYGIDSSWTIADLSCGYGAFFELSEVPEFSRCRFVGNDIDPVAVERAQKMFPHVKFSVLNALSDVGRKKFGFEDDERLVIVGNPPYNDVTSQINQTIKNGDCAIDADIRTRDLGMSSLLSYDKLRAEYVAVLHPLSYLVKKANFNATKHFFENYIMLEHVVFSSQEFAGTSKLSGFPVIVALYKRMENCGITYKIVRSMDFHTVEGVDFSLSGFDYVTDYVKKYPHKERFSPELLFYTMRDINALKRSRTFIKERIANAVDIQPDQLPYYCYIDCFKRYAQVPYWMGNFDVPFIANEFFDIANAVVADAKFHNQGIFGQCDSPDARDVERIKSYIRKALKQEKQ